jgi:hypothetical protein
MIRGLFESADSVRRQVQRILTIAGLALARSQNQLSSLANLRRTRFHVLRHVESGGTSLLKTSAPQRFCQFHYRLPQAAVIAATQRDFPPAKLTNASGRTALATEAFVADADVGKAFSAAISLDSRFS